MPSQKNIEESTCGVCGLAADFPAWRVIDAADTDLKQALMDERLFLWTCPHCGHRSRAYYELIYDDQAHGFRLLLTQSEGREALLAAAASMPRRAVGRSVPDGESLREKIRILEAELDDRAMEVYKLFLRRYIAESGQSSQEDDAAAPLLFQGQDGSGFLLSRRQTEEGPPRHNPDEDDWSGYGEEEKPKLIMASAAIYQNMLEDIEKDPSWDLSGEAYPYVDEARAEAYLNQDE